MSHSPFRRLLLVVLPLLAGAGPVCAGVLLEEGKPEIAAELATYGMQVDLERALHSVLPRPWRATLESSVVLTGKVSWGPNDTWVAVLRRISDRTDAGLLVDWDARQVWVRSVPATLEDAAAREKARRAATTPLPPFKTTTVPKLDAPRLAEPGRVAAPTPKPATQTTASPRPDQTFTTPANPFPAPPPQALPVLAPSPTEPVNTPNSARAFSRVSIEVPLAVLAARHDLTLRYEAPPFILPGPVTLLLGPDLAADVESLKRALGPGFPLAMTHYRHEKELLVQGATQASFISREAHPHPPVERPFFARLFSRSAPSRSMPAASDTDPHELKPRLPVNASEPMAVSGAAVPRQEPLVLELALGERLSAAISRLFKQQDWSVAWRAPIDFEVATATRVEGTTLAEVLERVLPAYGLKADLYKPSRVVVITARADTPAGSP